jgi:Ser/Thr protein kinase RdoA (MazF antagonist)
MDDAPTIRDRVLPGYAGWDAAGTRIDPLAGGLINRTYVLTAPDGARAVLQRVSAIFSPRIHENIQAVTSRLAEAGLVTPRLIPTREGRLFVDLQEDLQVDLQRDLEQPGAGLWRMLTHVGGVSFDAVTDAAQARAAGALIARFHAAVDGLPHTFVGLRAGAHDTPRHLARLEEAVAAQPAHRLAREVGALARAIAAGAAALPALPGQATRICHGDLKFSNVLFAGGKPPASERAVCLIDLDTLGPLSLAYELGDAWRSWCNRAGEDRPHAALDLEIFGASLEGYREGWGRGLDERTRQGLLLGVEWVSLELAARFAADALLETYFGWDAAGFPGRGEHNLVRARGQWSLHESLVATRATRAALLTRALAD